jgi:hypothetical protein
MVCVLLTGIPTACSRSANLTVLLRRSNMSEQPTVQETAQQPGPSPVQQAGGNRSWLMIGGIGCAGLLGLCLVVAMLAAIAGGDDDDETPVAEAPTPTAISTPEPDEVSDADDTANDDATPTAAAPTATPTPTATPEPPTPTPDPPSPTPTPTPAPPAPTPTPEPAGPRTSFGSGTFIVGEDIEPGLYAANSPTGSCYWERLGGFSGQLDDIHANYFGGDRQIVFIAETDVGFSSERCGTWTRDPEPIRADTGAPFGDGMFMVPAEVQPGTWRSEGASGACYWARLSNFSGELDGIIANSFGGVGDIVQIIGSDAGFESSGCGSWVRIGD